jgi:hypothetical protein
MSFSTCKILLLKECELVQKAAALQDLIHIAVKNREWTDFEGHFTAMNAIEEELAVLEQKREGLFAELGAGQTAQSPDPGDGKGRFYAFAARLPVPERNELTAIYRGLKLESLKLRMANESLMSYLAEARATLAGFFEMAFPDRGGRIYTMRGTPISHDMRSMVLNRRM